MSIKTLLLSAAGLAASEVPSPYWLMALGDAANNEINAVGCDTEGNIYYVGYTIFNGEAHGLVGKVDTLGALVWQKALAITPTPSNFERFYGIAVDNVNDFIYVSGYVGVSTSDVGIFLAKYNFAGVQQWQRTLNSTADSDTGYSVAVDPAGNVYISGSTSSQGAGGVDAFTAKYNSAGTLQWQRALGGASTESGGAVAVDVSGNVFCAGSVQSQGAGSTDILITKYNTSGTISWQRSLGGAVIDSTGINGIVLDSSANVYICGTTASQGQGAGDIVIAKYNTSGTLQWQKTFGGVTADTGGAVTIDSSANIYITGYISDTPSEAVLVAKLSSAGVLLWQNKIKHSGYLRGVGIAVHPYDGICISGYTSSSLGAGGTAGLLAKLPADGSRVGVYGPITYTTSTLTLATASLTAATRTLTGATTTLISASSSIPEISPTFSSIKFNI